MKFIADLEIHSRYARACSKNISLKSIFDNGKLKGLDLVGTADCLHPRWLYECKENLKEAYPGFYVLNDEKGGPPFFVVSGEANLIFSQKGKLRRIHLLLYLPSFAAAENVIRELSFYGKLESDGRPTLGLHAKSFLRTVLENGGIVVPSHCWTPWFGIFGSMSGFDSLEECFEEMTPYIPAIETGLSSDPSMNWRIHWLDNLNIVSFSDAHSTYPHRLGREATIFELKEPSFKNLVSAIKGGGKENYIEATIEFYPEEGMYHFDGHRSCGIRFSPQESIKNNYLCPVCQRPVTLGVAHRIDKLSQRAETKKEGKLLNGQPFFYIEGRPRYFNIVPLTEILAQGLNTQPTTKKVLDQYEEIVGVFGSEYKIFFEAEAKDVKEVSPIAGEGIANLRAGQVTILPGFDGQYGKIHIFEEKETKGLF